MKILEKNPEKMIATLVLRGSERKTVVNLKEVIYLTRGALKLFQPERSNKPIQQCSYSLNDLTMRPLPSIPQTSGMNLDTKLPTVQGSTTSKLNHIR